MRQIYKPFLNLTIGKNLPLFRGKTLPKGVGKTLIYIQGTSKIAKQVFRDAL